MYQTLDDLEKIQYLENEQNKSRKWIKRALLVLLLIILFFIVLIVYNLNIKKPNSSLSYSDHSEDSESYDKNIKLGDDNVYSRLFQLEPEVNDDKDIQSKNAEILSQLKDESFWEKKIDEKINELEGKNTTGRKFKILGY